MKVLIVGLGSIARKHIQALKVCAPEAEIYALRSSEVVNSYGKVINVFKWEEVPREIDFIIISNPTSEHYDAIKRAIVFGVPIFIEKPPFSKLEGAETIINEINQKGIRTYTAFNLRFHPVIKWLKQNLQNYKVYEVEAYCGSYLPDWRPNTDYSRSYSAQESLGGGVHLDLIHEMDYILWLFGMPAHNQSSIRKVSNLNINSVDVAHYILEYPNMNASIRLNYLRKDPKRTIEIVSTKTTIIADLLKGTVRDCSNDDIIFQSEFNVLDTYQEQMQYFIENLSIKEPYMNDIMESYETLSLSLS